MKTIILLLLAASASARTVQYPGPSDMVKLKADLEAASYAPSLFSCAQFPGKPIACRFDLPDSELRDPSPIINAQVFDDPFTKAFNAHQANRIAMIALAKEIKAEADPSTAAEVRARVVKLTALVLRLVFDATAE